MNSIQDLDECRTREERQNFLNMICFASCIEGLFFFGAFAYVYYLRSRGLLPGLATGTNWVFRDESGHMAFAFEVVETVRREEPGIFDENLKGRIIEMLDEAIACEYQFAQDVLGTGVIGLSLDDMHEYLQFIANQRLQMLGMPPRYEANNPFPFMEMQDVQELANFFERRVSAYQTGIGGDISFDAAF